MRARGRRDRDAGFHGRVFLFLKVGGFVSTAPPPSPITIIIIIKIIAVTITADETSGL